MEGHKPHGVLTAGKRVIFIKYVPDFLCAGFGKKAGALETAFAFTA
jgi:hypothetical protein